MTITAGRTIFEQTPYFIQRVFLQTSILHSKKSGITRDCFELL
jgi:hypothetical protein